MISTHGGNNNDLPKQTLRSQWCTPVILPELTLYDAPVYTLIVISGPGRGFILPWWDPS